MRPGNPAVAETADGSRPDGERARQVSLVLSEEDAKLSDADRSRRDEIERTIRTLADKKAGMKDADYYREMEKLVLEMARIYEGAGSPNGPSGQ